MRSYKDIFKDYLDWIVKKTGNTEYNYDTFMENHDSNTAKSFLYKSILELCYDKKDGFYYFTKIIIGDLLELGYTTTFRYNSLFSKWDKLIKNNKRVGILCARGHGKTMYFSLLNIYDMFLFKHRKILVESANQEQADMILEEIKRTRLIDDRLFEILQELAVGVEGAEIVDLLAVNIKKSL